MKDCLSVQSRLESAVDLGRMPELSDAERQHIAECPECRTVALLVESGIAMRHDDAQIAPPDSTPLPRSVKAPDGLAEQVVSRVSVARASQRTAPASEPARQFSLSPRRFRVGSFIKVAVPLAAAAILILMLLPEQHRNLDRTDVPEAGKAAEARTGDARDAVRKATLSTPAPREEERSESADSRVLRETPSGAREIRDGDAKRQVTDGGKLPDVADAHEEAGDRGQTVGEADGNRKETPPKTVAAEPPAPHKALSRAEGGSGMGIRTTNDAAIQAPAAEPSPALATAGKRKETEAAGWVEKHDPVLQPETETARVSGPGKKTEAKEEVAAAPQPTMATRDKEDRAGVASRDGAALEKQKAKGDLGAPMNIGRGMGQEKMAVAAPGGRVPERKESPLPDATAPQGARDAMAGNGVRAQPGASVSAGLGAMPADVSQAETGKAVATWDPERWTVMAGKLTTDLSSLIPALEEKSSSKGEQTAGALSMSVAVSAVESDRAEIAVAVRSPRQAGFTSPVHIVLLLDYSESMRYGNRLEEVRRAATQAMGKMGRDDLTSVIAFNEAARVMLPASSGDASGAFTKAVQDLPASGGTNLYEAIRLAAVESGKSRDRQRVRNIVLISDGLATVGERDPAAFRDLALRCASQGVAISSIGIGTEFDDRLLAGLARLTGGRFCFAPEPRDVAGALSREFGLAHNVVAEHIHVAAAARNASVVASAPPGAGGDMPAAAAAGPQQKAAEPAVALSGKGIAPTPGAPRSVAQIPGGEARRLAVTTPPASEPPQSARVELRFRNAITGKDEASAMTVAIPPETKKSLEAKAGEPGRLSFVVQVSQALDACADHLAAGQMSEAAGLLEDLCKKADAMAKAQGDANLLKMVEHLGNYRTVFQTIRDGGLGSGSDPARYLRITLRAASSSLGW